MKRALLGVFNTAVLATLAACGPVSGSAAGGAAGYEQVSTSEAVALMESETGYIILDVRTAEASRCNEVEEFKIMSCCKKEKMI